MLVGLVTLRDIPPLPSWGLSIGGRGAAEYLRRAGRRSTNISDSRNFLVMVIVAGLVGLALLLTIAAELGKRSAPAGQAAADTPADNTP